MPIEGLSDLRRLSRDFKIRLGGRLIKVEGGGTREPKYDEKKKQREEGGYPKEAEHFVMLPEEVPEDVRDLYGTEPQSLRMMLPMEWDARDPITGDEMTFNRYNRAYGRTHGLKCKGTGNNAEAPGMATTSDKAWAERIAQATGQAEEKVTLGGQQMFAVQCLGQDCCKYLRMVEEEYLEGQQKRTRMVKAQGVDIDAACKRVFILRAFLLHTSVDPGSPDYCKVLGLAEIASSSFHTMLNLQSDFDVLRSAARGESAMIPFRLTRVPITTFKPTRQFHYVLRAKPDYQEAQRWAAIPRAERFMNEEMRARLRAIEAAPLAPTYESVKDLVPPALLEAPQAGQPAAPGSQPGGSAAMAPEAAGTPLGASQGTETGLAGQPAGGEADRKLLTGELTELKALCGGLVNPDAAYHPQANPWKPEALARLKEIVGLYNRKHGSTVATDADGRVRFTDLTYDVYAFAKEYLTANIGPTEGEQA